MKKILVCTDGSNYAREACRYAAWLATKTKAKVEALYVSSLWDFELPFLLDLGASLGASPFTGVTGQLEEVEKKKAELLKDAVLHHLRNLGIEAGDNAFHHDTGMLVDCLDHYETGEDAADLIVLGKRGENADAARQHLGGNLERVVRAARKPCLVTNREFRTVKKAALAFDGSLSATKALDWFITETDLHGLELHVVSVDEGQRETDHSRDLDVAAGRLEQAGLPAQTHLLNGNVEDEIEAFTTGQDIDLLMMGAYGHSRIRELLIGSTTTDLIRRCKIPVMLFR